MGNSEIIDRNVPLTKYGIELFDNIVNIPDEIEMIPSILVLYRGLEDFKEDYLNNPGITFKTSDINITLEYAYDTLLVINYPYGSKQIHINDYMENAYLSYPNERCKITKI